MDPDLYSAIRKDDTEKLRRIGLVCLSQKTPLLNTPLHVAVQYERKECVEVILQKCPSLLWTANVNGDTALHIAARQGLFSITELLLHNFRDRDTVLESEGLEEGSRKLVRFANKDRDTALHEAARKDHAEIVKLLAEADPECEYSANAAGETPLFLAALYGSNSEMVAQILHTWPSAAHDGPNGMTALHAAAISETLDTMKLLIEKKSVIIRQADFNGRTALHYAARRGLVCLEELLKFDYSLAGIQDGNGMTPLHIAVSCGNPEGLASLTKYYPDRLEVVDINGQNIFHIAVVGGDVTLIRRILEGKWKPKGIVNQADNDGNTPLHLAAINGRSEIVVYLCDLPKGVVDYMARNKENLTAYDVFAKVHNKPNLGPRYWDAWSKLLHKYDLTQGNPLLNKWDLTQGNRLSSFVEEQNQMKKSFAEEHQQKKKERREKRTQQMQKVSDSHLVVAALIATVTFAAGFALPGGYKSEGQDEGMPALLKEASFKAFAISNTMAVLFSSLAVVSHFLMKLIDHPDATRRLLVWAFRLTLAAISAMMLAFATGTYAVLDNSPGLAISTCIIGCSFYLFCGLLLRKCYKDINISRRYRSLSFNHIL